MLDKKTRRLLALLVAAVAVAGIGVAVTLGSERLRSARAIGEQYEAQVRKLEQSLPAEKEILALRDRLRAELDQRKGRFYRPDEMNPYSFGTLIKKRLVAHGMSVVRYQLIEVKGESSLEFSVSGPIMSLTLFLKEVSESEKDWTISSLDLTMRGGTGTMDAVFRIGYEVLPAGAG
jgi:hypothetical protein